MIWGLNLMLRFHIFTVHSWLGTGKITLDTFQTGFTKNENEMNLMMDGNVNLFLFTQQS